MESKANTPWYADKSFLAIILTPILLFAAKKLGIDLNIEEIIAWFSMNIAFIAGNKYKSAAITVAEVKAEAAKKVEAAPAVSPATALNEIIK